MRAGLFGEVKFPEPIRLHWPTPGQSSWVAYGVASAKRCAQRWFCGEELGPHSPPIAWCRNSTRGTTPVDTSAYCEKSMLASSFCSAFVNASCIRLIANPLNKPLQLLVLPNGFACAQVALTPPV